MGLKICGSHLRYKVVNKCLYDHEQVEVVEKNKDVPLPFPNVLWIVSVCDRKPDRKESY